MGGFVQLFFILSGFSLCCGYYQSIKENRISLNTFYSKRYRKILPFFTLLVFFDLFATFFLNGSINMETFYEAFADLTLLFGFFPASDISVIGVGWSLGVIFGFYLLFPFFVYMLWDKKRAWLSFLVTLGIHYVCSVYFLADQKAVGCNVARWLCFFAAGGLIYLYKDEVLRIYGRFSKKMGILLGAVLVFAGLTAALLAGNSGIHVLLSSVFLIAAYSMVILGALGPESKIWYNRVSRYIGKMSFEIYLAHMMVYRVIEKSGFTRSFGETITSYAVTCILTIAGVVLFASVYASISCIAGRNKSEGHKADRK